MTAAAQDQQATTAPATTAPATTAPATTAPAATDQARIAEGEAAIRALRFVKRLIVVVLFIVGLGAGLVLYRTATPPLQYGTLPPLSEAAEPPSADALTDLVVAGDEAQLADHYDGDLLAGLSSALTMGPGANDPLVQVNNIQYLGSVAQGPDILAFYVATGQMSDGTDGEAGFSLRVRDGKVVGVN